MKRFALMSLSAIALAAGLAVSSASAAPAGGALPALKALPEAATAVEKTYWVVRCHGHGHYRKCHRVWVRRYH